ncbi:sugar transferase [Natronococcus sp. A-GB1]|uniref:sugar transferase n=1 Tax=Natronococcus sp. A-GB1 TaxID=3037648 RepID=UPI00241EE608|nr:sugar transferase [Natronococcus sp. A-GB1]MDG5761747.1 sugar transferase [Natronococcus sp. A-GB1]
MIGNNPGHIRAAIQSAPTAPVGFLSPALVDQSVEMTHSEEETSDPTTPVVTDGGVRTTNRLEGISGTERVGGLSQFPYVLRESDIDTVVLAFERYDRTERFGTLRICREQNVNALVRDSLATQVLTTENATGEFLRVDLQPWPWYGRLAKRLFDLVFATLALVVTAPLLVLIAVAIKLDSPGPLLYGQRRTARLGGTFSVWKFRSMLPESEDANPGCCRDRITPVGHVLRKTHLDEIPQLLSILTGEMSVVGPRPVWTEEERLLREDIDCWSKRWAVTPGLTGLAQIRDIDSTDAEEKLQCDLEYIEKQSMWFDLRIVALQLWQVATDSCDLLTGQDPQDESSLSSNEQTDSTEQ